MDRPQISLLVVRPIFLLHQLEKLRKLNCPVPVEVCLQHQVQHLEQGVVPIKVRL